MKATEYKAFKEIVETATSDNYIWHAGYLWLDLTDKQALEILGVLKKNPVCTVLDNGIRLPSGMELVKVSREEDVKHRDIRG